jgi:hypothetical protein
MTIRQQGGIFGRNPTFNNVEIEGSLTSNKISTSTNFSVALGAEGEYMRVGGDTSNNDHALRFTSSTGGGVNGAVHTILAPSAEGGIAFSIGASERVRIDSSGRLGLGTSSPDRALHVLSSLTLPVRIESTGTSSLIDFVDADTSGGTFRNRVGSNGNDLALWTSAAERMRIDSSGNVGIGTSNPSSLLDINGDGIRIRTAKTPATAGATGNQGEIAWDADYIYICVATDTWKRVAIASW